MSAWAPGDLASVSEYADPTDATTHRMRYGVRNATNDGFDLVALDVQAACPYAMTAVHMGQWPTTVLAWAEAVAAVAARTGEDQTTAAQRLAALVPALHAETGRVPEPADLTDPALDTRGE